MLDATKRALKALPDPVVTRLISARIALDPHQKVADHVLTRLRGDSKWGRSPFNGQQMRLKTTHALISAYSPDVFLETGTYMGDTTKFFLGNDLPVYTVELKRWFWLVARLQLGWRNPELTLLRGESVDGIRRLSQREYHRPLAYLDAHWWGPSPLRDEVSELLVGWDEVLVIVDDCRVPGDDGYGYDCVDGQPVGLDMLGLDDTVLAAYPALPSSQETGARRGTLYLARGKGAEAALRNAMSGGLLAPARAD